MKRALLFVFCALMSVQMFSQIDLPKDLFPTLAGLQRTACSEYVDCKENKTYLMQADAIKEINGKLYISTLESSSRKNTPPYLRYCFPLISLISSNCIR